MGKRIGSLTVLCVLAMISVSGAAIPASAATPAPTPLPPPTPPPARPGAIVTW